LVLRPNENPMHDKFTDGDSLALLSRLITEIGTPQLLRLLASVADQHAKKLAQEGQTLHATRCALEAKILGRASEAITD